MGDREKSLTINYADIGRGGVVRNVDPESLAPPNGTGIIAPTPLTRAQNVNLFEGLAIRRDGSTAFETVQASTTINGLFKASFTANKQVLVAGYSNNTPPGGAVEVYDEASDAWIIITPSGGVGNLVSAQPWRFAMVPRAADSPPVQMIFGTEGTSTFLWDGMLSANSAVEMTQILHPGSPTAAKFFLSFLSRAMAFNVVNNSGARQSSQIVFSIVGDGSDWINLGSGTLNLDDDPYPIVAGLVMGGRAVILKGGAEAGAIYVLTPTGISISPMRVDAINPGTNVGCLVPRSFIPLGSGVSFFIAHDAAYLYDGVRALKPFARGVARDITSRINPAAVDAGFAFYNRNYRQVELHIPVGSSTTPNEVWTFDVRDLRAWGPDTLGTAFYSVSDWTPQGSLSWATWGLNGSQQWNSLVGADSAQYFQWDLISDGLGTETIMYGAGDGITYQKTPGLTTDPGTTNITSEIDLPPITPALWIRDRQSGKQYRPDDVFNLRTVTIRHHSATNWIPVVQVSIDGSTFVTVSDGSTASATGGRLISKTYYPDNLIAPSVWFQPRITNTAGDNLSVKDIQLEFTYAGSARHE